MLRRLAAYASLAACTPLAACAACPADVVRCNSDADCLNGTSCIEGVCRTVAGDGEGEGEGEGGADVPAITSVDGDGSARAPSSTSAAPDDALPAAHRLRGALVVSGAHLDLVTSATLADAPLDILDNDGAIMRLALPTSLSTGALTLVLATATSSTAAQADVFLLQGEPGPPGHDSLLTTRDATTCNGVAIDSGVDSDDNGVLDVAEQTSSREVCFADTIDCSSGTSCVSSLPLSAPSIEVGGLPVLTHVVTPTTIAVPGDAPTVSAALAKLAGIRLDAAVSIVVSGDVDEPAAVVIDHPDGRRIFINGVQGAALHFNDTNGVVVINNGVGGIDVALQGTGGNTVGLLASLGATATTGSQLTITNFGAGMLADNGAFISAPGARVSGCVNGFFAINGGVIDAPAAAASNNSNAGFVAEISGILLAPSCAATGNSVGVLDDTNGTFVGSLCTLIGNSFGVRVENSGLATLDGAAVSSLNVDVLALVNSTARIDGASIGTKQVDASSVVVP